MQNRRACIISNPRAGEHDYGWRQAFGAGLARHGWTVEHAEDFRPGAGLLVLWGVRRKPIMARAVAAGAEVCVLERGYLGCRFTHTSVSFGGGLNGRGIFELPAEVTPARFDSLGLTIHPWRRIRSPTAHALLIGQVPGDASLAGVDIAAWYRQTREALLRAGYHVRFRPHPLARPAEAAPCSLAADLAGCNICVTYNSNAAVEAVLAGVPTVAMDEGSMAWEVTGRQVTDMLEPKDVAGWARRLAWKQYTRGEMASGFCAEVVGLA